MEIRAVQEAELDEMIALQCVIFRSDGYERYWGYIRGDSSYRLDQTRVVLVDGQIISTLRIWERELRIGSRSVRMGGIGGVGTHPDYRGRGYASALMRETADHLRQTGYDVGMLFSILPCSFYGQLGWGSLPLEGFQIQRGTPVEPRSPSWEIESFDEGRDLEQVAALYDECNARQSGSLSRPRSYWDTNPARLRGVLPTLVARRSDCVGGYLNLDYGEDKAFVQEVAFDREDASVLISLVNALVQSCEEKGIEQIQGEILHTHPIVYLILERWGGDLTLTGNDKAMLYPANLRSLFRKILPDLQSRTEMRSPKGDSVSIRIETNEQHCIIRWENSRLEIRESDPTATRLALPASLFWRILFGQSAWENVLPTLKATGVSVDPEVSDLLAILFPRRQVVYWGPDHF